MYNNNDLEEYNSLLTEKNIESLKSGIDLLIYNSDETKVDTLRDNNDIIKFNKKHISTSRLQ